MSAQPLFTAFPAQYIETGAAEERSESSHGSIIRHQGMSSGGHRYDQKIVSERHEQERGIKGTESKQAKATKVGKGKKEVICESPHSVYSISCCLSFP